MSDYAVVDGVIDASAEATGSTLYKQWAGEPARVFYVPGMPPYECFHVSVEPPSTDGGRVFARSIDTNDCGELEQIWDGPVKELDAVLSAAMATIETWKDRPQAEAKALKYHTRGNASRDQSACRADFALPRRRNA